MAWRGGSTGTTTVVTGDPTVIDWPPPLDPTQTPPPIAAEPKQLQADPTGDVLIGGLGNDLLQGGLGSDDLIGLGGADRLIGGLGASRFTSLADGAPDQILIQRDGSPTHRLGKRRYSGETVDVISELGVKILWFFKGWMPAL